jgi:hypothetical protein
MVPAVRPLRSLSMAQGCARIDSRPDTAKIGPAGRVGSITPGCLQLLGYEKPFHTAWTLTGHRVAQRFPIWVSCFLSPPRKRAL